MYPATQIITEKIRNQEPVVFLKFGDGEYQCIEKPYYRHNCDGDSYTPELRAGLISSFKYIITQPNVFIGAWHTSEVRDFWKRLAGADAARIQWADYHTIIIDKEDLKKHEALEIKRNLLKSIQESPLPKIIVCNELLSKMGLLFGNSKIINVSLRNWYVDVLEIFKKIEKVLEQNGKSILLFAAGQGTKVLISNLYNLYPENVYLDVGSGLDLLCSKKDSRGRGYSYDELYNVLCEMLPESWNDVKYNVLYEKAESELGIHL
jgi:hypothetical protein